MKILSKSTIYYNSGSYRVLLPLEITRFLKAEEGDTLVYETRKNGTVSLRVIKKADNQQR